MMTTFKLAWSHEDDNDKPWSLIKHSESLQSSQEIDLANCLAGNS